MEDSDRNKGVVLAYVAAFNAGDFDKLRALHAPDAVIHGVMGWGPIDEVIPIWRELHEGLAINLAVEDLVAEGDTVAARFTERGTFRAPFRGKAPTGKTYELTAMEWYVLKDGLIHRRWGARDAASQARQLEMA